MEIVPMPRIRTVELSRMEILLDCSKYNLAIGHVQCGAIVK